MRSRVAFNIAILVAALSVGGQLATGGNKQQSNVAQTKPGYVLPSRPGLSDFGQSFESIARR
jgi:hypothetical protein